jgi:membrane associated rhomboid family serine protease
VQPYALTALFAALATALAAVSVYAFVGGDSGRQLIVGAASAAVAAWLATLSAAAFRRRKR